LSHFQKFNMQHKGQLSVLIAPLDWGLGHATRCIPVIKELINQGARVVIASAGPQKALLSAEFPGLELLDLPGYDIRYKQGLFLKWGLVFQAPYILKQIKRENQWLADFIQSHKPDIVISDNRYGLYHPEVYCVFLTHQLAIQTGLGSLVNRFIMKWNYRLIRKFSVCWIPDWPEGISLAGKLSHPTTKPPVPARYVGILSRLKPFPPKPEKNTLLVLLSGPEPQRTDFEKCVLSQLEYLSLQCTVVRGLPGIASPGSISTDAVHIVNHLPAEQLNVLMNASDLIITRSGYSSIMDLVQLGRNAILVPTTGQAEQEYLGNHMQEMNWMVCVPQKNFNLKKAIQKFRSSNLTLPQKEEPLLGKAVEELINQCNSVKRSAFRLPR
jgi:UDP:flavonoid glycosyltransferase YjiC (YdhE family)